MQIGQRLEEVIHKQQNIAPGDSDWQMKQMPRTSALENAGFPLLAQQVKNFRKSYYGGQGREWLAKELGWTLADRLHPQYSLQQVRLQKCCQVWLPELMAMAGPS